MPTNDHRQIDPTRARQLRRELSPPERVPWSLLRNRRFAGVKFRRQQPIGPYIADFYCAPARLVIELDGRVHENHTERDAARDAWMREQGLEILRVPATDLKNRKREVLQWIFKTVRERTVSGNREED